MAFSAFSQGVSPIPSKDKGQKHSAPTSTPVSALPGPLTESATPYISTYIDNDFQQILKIVLVARLLVA